MIQCTLCLVVLVEEGEKEGLGKRGELAGISSDPDGLQVVLKWPTISERDEETSSVVRNTPYNRHGTIIRDVGVRLSCYGSLHGMDAVQ